MRQLVTWVVLLFVPTAGVAAWPVKPRPSMAKNPPAVKVIRKPVVPRPVKAPSKAPRTEPVLQDSTWHLHTAIGVQSRFFPSDPAFAGQATNPIQMSATLRPQLVWQTSDQRQKFELIPFLRVDQIDSSRTHFDIREGSYTHAWGEMEMSAGIKTVFWGVTESQQLVNILNQIDLVEDYRGRNRLGQPMVSLSYSSEFGIFSAYAMTGFRERTFPGVSGRLRGPSTIDPNGVLYESSLKQWQPDGALRWTHAIESLDIGVYQFHGTSREPDIMASSGGSLVAYYPLIDQTGLDMQLTTGALLTKFEGIFNARDSFSTTYFGLTTGFEYTFFQVFGSDADLGTILEYSYDSRGVRSTHLNQDVFAGLRLGVNDLDNSALLAGVIANLEGSGAFLLLEASRRLGDSWSLAISSALFSTTKPGTASATSAFRKDDHLGITLTYFLP